MTFHKNGHFFWKQYAPYLRWCMLEGVISQQVVSYQLKCNTIQLSNSRTQHFSSTLKKMALVRLIWIFANNSNKAYQTEG